MTEEPMTRAEVALHDLAVIVDEMAAQSEDADGLAALIEGLPTMLAAIVLLTNVAGVVATADRAMSRQGGCRVAS